MCLGQNRPPFPKVLQEERWAQEILTVVEAEVEAAVVEEQEQEESQG